MPVVPITFFNSAGSISEMVAVVPLTVTVMRIVPASPDTGIVVETVGAALPELPPPLLDAPPPDFFSKIAFTVTLSAGMVNLLLLIVTPPETVRHSFK